MPDYSQYNTIQFDEILNAVKKQAKLTEVQPISATELPLPDGASTSDNQETLIASLLNILAELELKADLLEIQPVSAATLPLPDGASTSAKQDSIISLLPQDSVENVPVVIGNSDNKINEGYFFKASSVQAIGVTTVKFAIETSTETPHMEIKADAYGGGVRVDVYKTATFTGGTALTNNNRDQGSSTTSVLTITSGVTSTDGTLINSFHSESDVWILDTAETYRVDAVGLSADTEVVITFNWY